MTDTTTATAARTTSTRTPRPASTGTTTTTPTTAGTAAGRPPRALKIGAILAGVAVVSVAAYSVLGGGTEAPSAGPAAAGASHRRRRGRRPRHALGQQRGRRAGADRHAVGLQVASSPPAPRPRRRTPRSPRRRSPRRPRTPRVEQQQLDGAPPSSAPPRRPATSAAAAAAEFASPTFTSLGPGSSGAAVSQLQQNLKRWGGYFGWPNLKVTGTWDTATTNAVQAFQDDKGRARPTPTASTARRPTRRCARPWADSRIRAPGRTSE